MASAPQPVTEPATREAIFLVLTVNPGDASRETVRAACGDLPGLVRAVGQRDVHGQLSCVAAFGSDAWDRLFGPPRPAELHGFRYFDDRDLTGFVDGTENPVGPDAVAATIVGDEDAPFAGGSYVLVQRYVHDLAQWDALVTEEQERIIGRTKLSDIELAEDVKPTNAHNALTVIEEDGEEVKILRHNMAYGEAALGDSGTYFIGYARSPRVLEQMLEHMFVGSPPGNYDRLLDFTHAVTGSCFFAPSLDFLEAFGG